jgi:hypothetical protein
MGVNRRALMRWLVFAMTAIVASMALASVGLAATKKKKASINVTVPSNAKVNQVYNIKVKGYSGRFNALSVYASKIKCPKNAASASATFTGGYTYPLTTKHKYKQNSNKFVASTSGKRTACVYLYDSSDPGGSQKHKFKSYSVSP